MGLVIAVVWVCFKSVTLVIAFVLFFLFFVVKYFKIKAYDFTIYEDHIEFKNKSDQADIETIPIADIFQVRFEDEFKNTSPLISYERSERIYLYTKNICFPLLKKGKIILQVADGKGERLDALIKILAHFQKKGKPIYVITKHQNILETLGLKNWSHR